MTRAIHLLRRIRRLALGPETAPDGFADPHDEAPPRDELPDTGALDAAAQPHLDAGTVSILADKVLLAWLHNRYQLLFPFNVDLRQLDVEQAGLVIHAMVNAARADGSFDEKERARVHEAAAKMSVRCNVNGLIEGALHAPKCLHALLAEVRDVRTAAIVYAASLMVVDQRDLVNRQFLKYLAARLQLSPDLVGSLDQRFRSSG